MKVVTLIFVPREWRQSSDDTYSGYYYEIEAVGHNPDGLHIGELKWRIRDLDFSIGLVGPDGKVLPFKVTIEYETPVPRKTCPTCGREK